MNKQIEDIDERKIAESHFLHEVLTEPPHWIVRWGEVWVLVFMLTLLLGAGMIRYPDRLTAEAVVTTTFPPIEIKAPIGGHIEKLFVNDLKQVKKQDVLFTIGDDYDWEDVLFVERQLLLGLQHLDTTVLNHIFAAKLNVGPLQASLEQAHTAYQNYLLETSIQPAFQQQIATQKEILQLQLLIGEKRKQQLILEQKLSIKQKDFTRHANQELINIKKEAAASLPNTWTYKPALDLTFDPF
jgi:multidrug efflux pump subunit AcrA (membrane-fusion protein)